MEDPENMPSTSNHHLNINRIKEEQDLDLDFELDDNSGLNSNATADESMAVEALRQLGTSAVYAKQVMRIHSKVPEDLPLLTCPICEVQFRTAIDLQNHTSICKHTQLRCHICGENFERKIDLNNHLVCHAVERPHSCRVCGTLFVNRSDFNLHMQTHGIFSDLMQCTVCGLLFQRSSSLSNHMKIHNYKPGRALRQENDEESTDQLLDTKGMQNALNESKTSTLPPLNGISGLTSWDLHDELSQTEVFPAEVELTISQDLTVNLNNHESSESEQNEQPSTSGMNSDKPHVCTICRKCFAREKALISHLKLHETLLTTTIPCERCGNSFNSERAIIAHTPFCLGIIKMELPPSELEYKTTRKPVKRLVDGKKKVFNENLFKHECDQCKKKFSTKQKLHRHQWIHRKKIYPCEICASVYHKKEDLDLHRLTNHQASSAFWCNDCGKSFASRQGLWEHNRLHKSSSNTFTCQDCQKKFTSRQGFLIHQRAHNDERPYGCRFCWKAFRDGGTLRKHERIHTGERPHTCPICSKSFNQKVVLREHVRCLHANSCPKNDNDRYECSICSQEIADKDELCLHLVKHSDHLASAAKQASKRNIGVENKKLRGKLKKDHNEESELMDDPPILEHDLLHLDEGDEMNVAGNTDLQSFENTNFSFFSCHVCGGKFISKELLSEHLQVHL